MRRHCNQKDVMNHNQLDDIVSSNSELTAAVKRRARHIVILSELKPWPKETKEHYRFLPPDRKGIHACERVYHPGASRLDGYEDFCDLVLGGSEVLFALDPAHQQTVRFCEQLLATLYEEAESRKIAHSPCARELLKNTDWSVKDGIGPSALHTPSVIGYSDPKNLSNRYHADKPAVIWSKHWQLSTDPIDSLLKRVDQIIEEHIHSLHPSKSKRYAPHEVDDWINEAITSLRLWIEARRDMPMISVGDLSYAQLPNLPLRKRLEKGQIEEVCEKLANRIRGRLEKEWSAMFRAPASSMYDKASLSFRGINNTTGDCWGYPFAFDMAFGNGIVKVRCECITSNEVPDAKGGAGATLPKPPPDDEDPNDWLSLAQAAEYACVTTRTIRTWLKQKNDKGELVLPSQKRTGRKVFILRKDLTPLCKNQKHAERVTELDRMNQTPHT